VTNAEAIVILTKLMCKTGPKDEFCALDHAIAALKAENTFVSVFEGYELRLTPPTHLPSKPVLLAEILPKSNK
jgi:hypothetical protein